MLFRADFNFNLMKAGQRLWTKDELVLALNLYCKLPFGQLHSRNKEIIELSRILSRTPGSLAFKLVNFASLDPSLQARGIKGASNTSKLDKDVWNSYYNHWDIFPFDSEMLLKKMIGTTINEMDLPEEDAFLMEGKTKEQLVKVRVNQYFFRRTVLASYNNRCCITGISQKELLIAGHIKPWGMDEKNRLNPRNGISINALHDKAFELGFITIAPNYKIKVSPLLLKNKDDYSNNFFRKFHGKQIFMPSRFLPDIEFLKFHNQERFRN